MSISGDSFSSRNTPALTMVEECSSADVGVGATIAPSSHVWTGIWAALIIPATARRPTISRSHLSPESPARSDAMSRRPYSDAMTIRAARKHIPPTRLNVSCLNELLTASSVLVYPIRANEHRVVTSQKKNIHTRSLDRTIPNIALRNV